MLSQPVWQQLEGKWIVVMDCDLQDQPEEIVRLLAKAQEDYEAILARRGQRTDSFLTMWVAHTFYRVPGYLTGQAQAPEVNNFGRHHRRLISTVLKLLESTRYFPTIMCWAGFRQTTLSVHHDVNGRPLSYTSSRRFQLSLDILISNSDKPLRLTVFFGLLLACGVLALGLIMLVHSFLGQIDVLGYASLMSLSASSQEL